MSTTEYDYDYLVIGGGSGGIGSAKRAASLHGAKVAVIEKGRLGGTCVNVGCVPKKVMWNAATIADTLSHDAHHYGFDGVKEAVKQFNWPTLKNARDAYVKRLNGIYANGFKTAGVEHIQGTASFEDEHTLRVDPVDSSSEPTTVTAKNILIATGGHPFFPPGEGVDEHCICSDGFFALEELPKVAVLVGAGYIAVELAGVLNSLGSEVHLVVRQGKALREFDTMISDGLDSEMTKAGIHIHRNTKGVASVVGAEDGTKTVTTISGETISGANIVMMATGRKPNVEGLNLDKVGVSLTKRGHIQVDQYQNTSSSSIFALGDVCGAVELTPMAIAAGRRLADRIFGGEVGAKVSYEHVPTVVFSHPTIGTLGVSEKVAIEKYGEDNIKTYTSAFANLYYGIFDLDAADKPKTRMKLITAGAEEKVVGIHVIGMGSDEMMQGFGVAMKMGMTKSDMDSCIAIHPTASEELVTMGVWGTHPAISGAKVSPLNGAPSGEPTLESKM